MRLVALQGSLPFVGSGELQKHLFYGTALILLFIGTLSSVFRDDIEAKVVSVVSASILLFVAALHYVRRHQSLP
ncbi:MAG: hypothetical protein M3438_06740 [Pseudomonadota bacterium]|nr:hypothetical protein [Sphingomonas sp.]MDQ3478838.1 hypothetical protein [Pseudomonadota bacterium]